MGSSTPSAKLNIDGTQYGIQPGLVRRLGPANEIIDGVPNPERVIQAARALHLPADVLTYLNQPLGEPDERALYTEEDNLAVLSISSYEEWFTRQVHRTARNKIRKAAKQGVVVRVEPFTDALAAALVDLFNEKQNRRGRRYAYFGWDLEKVKSGWDTESERSRWLVAYHEGVMIGFIKLVVSGDLARTSGDIARDAYRDKAPMNALYAKAVEVCAEEKVSRLVYGRYEYGQKGEDSLTVFKESNGFEKLLVHRCFAPLNWRGALGLRLGLHRGVSQLVPAAALRTFLRARAAWHRTGDRQ